MLCSCIQGRKVGDSCHLQVATHDTRYCLVFISATSHTRLRALHHYISRTLIGRKGGAGPSSLHTTLEGPNGSMRMQDGCKVYVDSYMASSGTCSMVTPMTYIMRVRTRSHMTSHYNCSPMTTLHDFGGVLGHPLDTFC